MTAGHAHESLDRQAEDERSTERALGLTFAAVCAAVGAVQWYHDGGWWIAWLLAAALFLLLALAWTAPLRPLNAVWHRFALLLFHVMNPVIMAVVFYLTIVPTGLLMRLAGKDPLKLKLDRTAPSYWEMRTGPGSQNMKNQF